MKIFRQNKEITKGEVRGAVRDPRIGAHTGNIARDCTSDSPIVENKNVSFLSKIKHK